MMHEDLLKVLGQSLTEREAHVLRQRYGLNDGRTRTLEEIGRGFSVTRERVRQIESRALQKLRSLQAIGRLADYKETSAEEATTAPPSDRDPPEASSCRLSAPAYVAARNFAMCITLRYPIEPLPRCTTGTYTIAQSFLQIPSTETQAGKMAMGKKRREPGGGARRAEPVALRRVAAGALAAAGVWPPERPPERLPAPGSGKLRRAHLPKPKTERPLGGRVAALRLEASDVGREAEACDGAARPCSSPRRRGRRHRSTPTGRTSSSTSSPKSGGGICSTRSRFIVGGRARSPRSAPSAEELDRPADVHQVGAIGERSSRRSSCAAGSSAVVHHGVEETLRFAKERGLAGAVDRASCKERRSRFRRLKPFEGRSSRRTAWRFDRELRRLDLVQEGQRASEASVEPVQIGSTSHEARPNF